MSVLAEITPTHTARTLLFVPGDRADRFTNAAASGADLIVLDLEDAVEPSRKSAARNAVDRWLTNGGGGVVRINGTRTAWHTHDVAMVSRHKCPVMLPKAHSTAQIDAVAHRLPECTELVALIETAAGVVAAPEICAHPKVVRAAFGSVDLAADLGVEPDEDRAFSYPRSALVLASASAHLAAPLHGVTVKLGNDGETILRSDAIRAARLGFRGKLCIRPRQIPAVNEIFTPSDDQVRWAHRVVAAVSDGGATVIEGLMVDKPVIERARRVLQRSRQFGLFDGIV